MITSTRHPLVQAMRRAGGHPRRDPLQRIVLDGPRLIQEALDAGIIIEAALIAGDEQDPAGSPLGARLRDAGARVCQATLRVVQAAGRVTTSQGVVALARRPSPPDAAILTSPGLLLLVADGIQDPGNLGTMVRTAAASGASAVAVTEGTADPFQPKAMRASMGAAFRVPVLGLDGASLRAALVACGVRVIVADARGDQDYTSAPLGPPLAIVVGNESAGPDPAWFDLGTRVRIPLLGPVESLNAAVAAGVLLYEVVRRRGAPPAIL
ncbi:MAG: RNA methyltransferase [bacterium]|nr:RNA methyltransferase [bacterium]